MHPSEWATEQVGEQAVVDYLPARKLAAAVPRRSLGFGMPAPAVMEPFQPVAVAPAPPLPPSPTTVACPRRRQGRLSGVGLDVYDPEPPVHHPLFDHPDVLLTPHLMGLSTRATAATFADAARGVDDVLAGRRPAALANPEWAATDPLEER